MSLKDEVDLVCRVQPRTSDGDVGDSTYSFAYLEISLTASSSLEDPQRAELEMAHELLQDLEREYALASGQLRAFIAKNGKCPCCGREAK